MFDGYAEFGGVEVWNTARLMAYVDAGAVPPGLDVEDPTDADPRLHLVLGDAPYTSPAGDVPGWVDLEDPDTFDAAGILPLSIIGWDGSSRTVAIEEAVRGGGIARAAVFGPKTIQVTALLLGSTAAATDALYTWLTDVLHRTCEADVEAPLVGFNSNPPVVIGSVDQLTDPIDYPYRSPGQFSVTGGAASLDAAPVVVATNEWPNPEYRTSAYPWGASSSATTVSHAATESGAVLITPTTPGTSTVIRAVASGVALAPNQSYLLGIDLRLYGSDPPPDLPLTIYYGDTPLLTASTVQLVNPSYFRIAFTTGPAPADLIIEGDLGPGPEQRSLAINRTIVSTTTAEYFDGATPDTADLLYAWTGTPDASASTKSVTSNVRVQLAAPVSQILGPSTGPICDTVTARWTVIPGVGADLEVTPAFLAGGEVVWEGPTTLPLAGGTTVVTATSEGFESTWQPVLIIEGDVGDQLGIALTLSHRTILSPAACGVEYRRTYPRVATVDGPNVTNTDTLDCGAELVTVEWTWVATTPWRYSDGVPLVQGFGQALAPTLVAPGVVTRQLTDAAATPWRCDAPVPVVSCAPDPGNPGFLVPPAPPAIPDTNRVTIQNQVVAGVQVGVPSELIPDGDGAFTFTIANDGNDKVGLRLRVYDNATGLFQPDEVCDFAYEYHLDYLAPDAVFTIDGTTGEFRVLCAGNLAPDDASGTVRGNYGGPVLPPSASCDGRYLIVLQWLATYPRTVVGYYTSGQDTGDLELTVDVHKRES